MKIKMEDERYTPKEALNNIRLQLQKIDFPLNLTKEYQIIEQTFDNYDHLKKTNAELFKAHHKSIETILEQKNVITESKQKLATVSLRNEKLEKLFAWLQTKMYVCYGFMEMRVTTKKNYAECLHHSWTRFYNGKEVCDDNYIEMFNLWMELTAEKK